MTIEEKIIIFREIIDQFKKDFYPDISAAVISFKNIGIKDESKYIYDGHEKIPFNERHSTYQEIFINKFLHS
ncbi:MAG: hypothetical protein KGD65_15775 [Candidatus Lokiarchaeota archaeon]|nr:hypothetical protein [Candidatus Lokiarchaeota archaeon]